MTRRLTAVIALCTFAACGEEPAPPSVTELMDDPILLEATIVRCGQDRDATRYDPACVNATEAAGRLAAAEEQARREELEAQSAQKRQALRRAMEAAAEARRQTLEEQRRREEAALFGEFEPLPPAEETEPQVPPVDADDNAAPEDPSSGGAPPESGSLPHADATESATEANADAPPALDPDAVREN